MRRQESQTIETGMRAQLKDTSSLAKAGSNVLEREAARS